MRMYDNDIPRLVFRIAGVASIAAGVLMTAGFVLHPAGEDATFGTDPMWIPAHALLWMAFAVALLGWVGVYIAQASKAGILGVAAFGVIIIGTALASWIFSSEVTFVPVIAAEAPALFKKTRTLRLEILRGAIMRPHADCPLERQQSYSICSSAFGRPPGVRSNSVQSGSTVPMCRLS